MSSNKEAMAQSNKENVLPISLPQVGQKFKNLDDAWSFWVNYGGRAGFEVRKRSSWTSKVDGNVTSCRYVCAKEGRRGQDKRDHLTKNPRAETRTSCDVRMCLSFDRVAGYYEVVEVMLAHNHGVYSPQTFHLMSSQRRISELQAFEIETADDSRIRPKAAHELASRQVGGRMNLSYTCRDHKNHLQSRRQRELAYGQAGSMLKYFQDKISENPSFQYTLQLDCEEQIATIFWADAKMCIDYAHFGDVVTFDTTFGTNKEYRPFGVFVGFNHFRETVIFGAALMFDETRGSFKWLFQAFLAAHNGKQPRAIFTDQDTAMGLAVGDVFTEAWHGLCTYHIMQNAVKHLCNSKEEESKSKKEEDEEPHILLEFSACMYNIEDKTAFEEAFGIMRNKADKRKASWLDIIYKFKEKWAECYMRDIFTLGMRSTQLSESFNSDLKKYLKSDFDIIRFLKHFERAVQGKRDKELDAEFEARKKLPRIRMETPMLLQTSKLYTPTIFDAFQTEYGRSMAACTRALDGDNTYAVAIVRADGDLSSELERIVVGDPVEQTASCSCFQFKRTGVLCGHALKVLDLMNIKLLPNHYLLKRWTREARYGTIQDTKGRDIVENPKLDAMLRYKFLSHKFHDFAYKAASDPECSLLVDNALDYVAKQVEEKMRKTTSILSDPSNVQPNVQQDESLLSSARLKKKEVQPKSSKRHRSWLDKTRKFKKKEPKKSTQQEKDGIGETQLPTGNVNKESNAFTTFIDLLTGTSAIDDIDFQDLL